MIATRYSAFISYRHMTPDQEIAQKLHRLIETYSIPSALRKDGARHPGKVFRDQEELPLSADLGRDIETALENSDWLICICSPRYLESRWCQRELEYFIEYKGRDHVLTVLAEGEPENSFPELLRFETDANGNRIEREPLAADVRGASLADSLKRLKKEKYRILAPMAGTTFDGLYQRQRRRTMRNILAAALAAVLVLGGFLAYALVQNRRISDQNTQITAQNRQISQQNEELTHKNEQIESQNAQLSQQNERIEKQNTELSEKNEQIEAQNIRIEEERAAAARNECDLLVEKSVYYSSVNRKQEATKLALEAEQVSGTVDGYGKESIREALAVSCFMGDFAVEAELDFPGLSGSCFFSPDGKKIAVVDSRSSLTLCSAETGERLWVSPPFSHDITSVHWNAESTLLAVTAKWGHIVCIIDAATGEHLKQANIPWACNAVFDGKDLLIAFSKGLIRWETSVRDDYFPYVFEIDEDQHLTSMSLKNERYITICQSTSKPKIYIMEIGKDYYSHIETEDSKVIIGYTVSPDGEWLFVHQYDLCFVINLRTDEIRWKVTVEKPNISVTECHPVWTGDTILDCGNAFDANTGEIRYTTKPSSVILTADEQYFAGATAIYRVADGSWFADVPGDLMGFSPEGDKVIVYHTTEYGRGLPGDPDAIVPRTGVALLELFPGGGSQYTVDQYVGTILEIPDYTEPEHEEGTILMLNDPYGTSATSHLLSRDFFSPNARYYMVINHGAYIPIYDLEKGNEPIARIYDFSVGDHVEAQDVSFSADSRYAAVAGVIGPVVVYELETGRLVQSFTDTYLARTLSGCKFNRSGNYLMVADYSCLSFRIYSVTNGQTLYVMHAEKEVEDWGFDEKTGDAVLKYKDGSALIARMFEDEEALFSYARERVK